MVTKTRAYAGVPAGFRKAVARASRGGAGFRHAGYELAADLHTLNPCPGRGRRREEQIERLAALLQPPKGEPDGVAVLAWLEEHCADALELVPRRRRLQVVAGVVKAIQEGVARL